MRIRREEHRKKKMLGESRKRNRRAFKRDGGRGE